MASASGFNSSMSTKLPPIDPHLTEGPALSVRYTSKSAFEPFATQLSATAGKDGRIRIESDARRDRLLQDYRSRFSQQVIHDLSYNLQHLWKWASGLDSIRPGSLSVLHDAQIRDGFARLDALRRLFMKNDFWSGNRVERQCWNAVQQFYFDALAQADRLLNFEERRLRQPARRLRSRRVVDGVGAFGLGQVLANVMEQAFPNSLNAPALRSLLPWISYFVLSTVAPWPGFRYQRFLRRCHHALRSGLWGRTAGADRPAVVLRSVREFLANDYFFDPRTGQTRHNIILAFSHRHSVLDFPFLAEAFLDLRHCLMANEAYLPNSAARDPRMVLVAMGQGRSISPALQACVGKLVVERMPLAIAVDGWGPHLFYGQQMRPKRGIRLLIEYLAKHSPNKDRKTYIVPLSLDDVVTFLLGLDDQVSVKVHRPICTDDIAPVPDPPNPQALNWGDPLLSYLESLFLCHTGQIRHGWRTPRVIETVRRVARQRRRSSGIGNWIRSRFHASLHDLSCDQSTADVDSIGP